VLIFRALKNTTDPHGNAQLVTVLAVVFITDQTNMLK